MVRDQMEDALPLDGVPVLVDIEVGDDWLDAH